MTEARAYRISVAGVNEMGTGDRWRSASLYPGGVAVEHETSNRHDGNAVALRFFGEAIGYLPRGLAETVAPLLDAGWGATIPRADVDILPGRRRVRDMSGDWCYEDDWDDGHYVVMATLVLEPPMEGTA